MGAVIPGDFFGWNFGFVAGGFAGLLIALGAIFRTPSSREPGWWLVSVLTTVLALGLAMTSQAFLPAGASGIFRALSLRAVGVPRDRPNEGLSS